MFLWLTTNNNHFKEVKYGGPEVYLDKRQLGDEGATQIAKALEDPSTKVQTLRLEYNNIGVGGAMFIARALMNNSRLQVLWLGHNNIGDEGARHIARALSLDCTLKELYLDNNNISDAGATYIANALSHNSTLKEMWLDHNNIGNTGATAIGIALKFNSTLQKLCLSENDIRDEVAAAISKPLKTNLLIFKEYIRDELKSNSSPQNLLLSENDIEFDGLSVKELKESDFGSDLESTKEWIEPYSTLHIKKVHRSKSDRALVALDFLAADEESPCPKLIWLVPQQRIKRRSTRKMKDLFKDAFFQEIALYFLCENTYTIGHKDPIILNFGRYGAMHLLPLVKLFSLTLKMAGADSLDLPFPFPRTGQSEHLQFFEELFIGVEEIHESLRDMEQWVNDIVKEGESVMEESRVARIKGLVSRAYGMINQMALQEENLRKWQTSMTAEVMYDDNGEMCQIKWVKI